MVAASLVKGQQPAVALPRALGAWRDGKEASKQAANNSCRVPRRAVKNTAVRARLAGKRKLTRSSQTVSRRLRRCSPAPNSIAVLILTQRPLGTRAREWPQRPPELPSVLQRRLPWRRPQPGPHTPQACPVRAPWRFPWVAQTFIGVEGPGTRRPTVLPDLH